MKLFPKVKITILVIWVGLVIYAFLKERDNSKLPKSDREKLTQDFFYQSDSDINICETMLSDASNRELTKEDREGHRSLSENCFAIKGDLTIGTRRGSVIISPDGSITFKDCSAKEAALIVRQGFDEMFDGINKKEDKGVKNDQHGVHP